MAQAARQEKAETGSDIVRRLVVRLLNDLNQAFSNDLIWLTVIEPIKDGKPLTTSLWGSGDEDKAKESPDAPKYELRLQGLYRKNNEGDQQVVNDYAAKLSKMEHFDAPDFENNKDKYLLKLDTGAEESRFAYRFELKLPLKNPPKFK